MMHSIGVLTKRSRVQQRVVGAAFLTAAAMLLVHVSGSFHFLLVQHTYCPHHDQIEDIYYDGAQKPELAHDPSHTEVTLGRLHSPEQNGGNHDTCVVLAVFQRRSLTPEPADFSNIVTSSKPHFPPAICSPHLAAAVYSIAPKQSPPLAA